MATDLVIGADGPYTPPSGGSTDLTLGPVPGSPGADTDVTLSIGLKLGVSLTASGANVLPGPTLRAPWSAADPTAGVVAAAPWDAASPVQGGPVRAPWAYQPLVALGTPLRAPWQAATPAQSASVRAGWGLAAAASGGARIVWDRATGLAPGAVLVWGRALGLAPSLRAPWGVAGRRGPIVRAPWGPALLLPAPNLAFPPEFNPPRLPYALVDLHFCVPITSVTTDLVLGVNPCEGALLPPAGGTVTSRGSYVSGHSITIVRLPDLTPLPVSSFTIAADYQSSDWQMQAVGTEGLFALLAPSSGLPRQVRVTIDGLVFEFAVDTLRRNRAHNQRSVSFTARSYSSLLGEPYFAQTAYLNTFPRTAQQVLEEVLEFTGIGLDWRCTDWLIPERGWSFTGTPLAAVRRVAEAIGAIVQSPRAGDAIIVAPRYPVRPWLWPAATPDVILPLDVFVTDGYERRDEPGYDGVYVSGQAQGVRALVKRTGSAPSLFMPMVTDPLITATEAAEQRGESLLGRAGPGALMTGRVPVLTGVGEPGVIDVGQLVRVDDPAGAWKGLVRAVTVSFSFADPKLRQDLTLERKL